MRSTFEELALYDKYVDSRYTLVSMVSKRARMIGADLHEKEAELAPSKNRTIVKPVTQAVDEITDGVIGYIRSEAIEKAREYEQEKFEAISQLENEMSDGDNSEYDSAESDE